MFFKNILYFLITSFFISSILFAASNNNKTEGQYEKDHNDAKANKIPIYKQAEKIIIKAKKNERKGKAEKAQKLYRKAYSKLIEANRDEPINSDILNYLGFTSGKLGNLEDAEIYYLIGLEINPEHRGINENLGDFYVITKRIDLANERLEILKNCNCEEYNKLKEVIEGTKKIKY